MLSPAFPIPVFFFASFLFVVGGGGGGNSGVSVKIVGARIEERIEALDCALEERVPPPVIGGRGGGIVVAAAEGRVGKPRKERWGRGGRVVWSFEIRVGGDFGVWEGKVVR